MASDSRASVVSDRPELSDLSSTTEAVEAARNRAVAQLRELVAERKVAPWQAAGFLERFDEHFPALLELFRRTYGSGEKAAVVVVEMGAQLASAWAQRPAELRAVDDTRGEDPEWYLRPTEVGGVCYIDRWAGDLAGLRSRIPYLRELGLTYLHVMPPFKVPAGNSDGGYAVSSYRELRPDLGTMAELADTAGELREAGISLVVDFVLNHTASDHKWAQRAKAGDPEFEELYWIYPDREMPDAFERTTREIFPDDHPGSFTPVAADDPRWVWTTFHDFQWDLNWTNPRVLALMAQEMLFLANQGAEVLRLDAVAFLWKQLGTTCESLPQAHWIVQVLNRVCRIAAPATIFKSEAIVHPDEVVQYVHPDECQISYNPLQMALTWEALATRKATLLDDALAERHELPAGTAWVNYVRSHDDIGWTFSDEDAARHGIDGYGHRRFLNDFYTGRFEGSFADGVAFQYNPRTGDARVCGTTASLASTTTEPELGVRRVLLAHGIAFSTGGLPLIYLGDELAQTNDEDWAQDPDQAGDARWAHRPRFPEAAFEQRLDRSSVPGQVYAGLRQMLAVRAATPELDGADLIGFDAGSEHLVAYQRPGLDPEGRPSVILCLANVSEESVRVEALTLSGFEPEATSLLAEQDTALDLSQGLEVGPLETLWLRVRAR
ncbi:amylosucrase [Kocuria sp. NBRC 114282]|uniref:alpha-amylase family protein n=1 Tax=Kocuria sp. NBRC 114282 TaxID=2994520 RepID=UPI0024A4E31E|nr:alpha-amylase family protein [Kocuria sp. NBRC 114282]GLU86977.1 amylosucrase [Kocuria sp. NBRC 114282]